MRVLMKSYMTGPNFEYRPGDIAEFDDAEGARVISVGGAVESTAEDLAEFESRQEKVNLDAMTVSQLKELAAERKVDLGDATKKADIIAALELAAEASA